MYFLIKKIYIYKPVSTVDSICIPYEIFVMCVCGSLKYKILMQDTTIDILYFLLQVHSLNVGKATIILGSSLKTNNSLRNYINTSLCCNHLVIFPISSIFWRITVINFLIWLDKYYFFSWDFIILFKLRANKFPRFKFFNLNLQIFAIIKVIFMLNYNKSIHL